MAESHLLGVTSTVLNGQPLVKHKKQREEACSTLVPWMIWVARERPRTNETPPYSWHATQEHRWFGPGTTCSIVVLVVLTVLALISFSNCNNPGAPSSAYTQFLFQEI